MRNNAAVPIVSAVLEVPAIGCVSDAIRSRLLERLQEVRKGRPLPSGYENPESLPNNRIEDLIRHYQVLDSKFLETMPSGDEDSAMPNALEILSRLADYMDYGRFGEEISTEYADLLLGEPTREQILSLAKKAWGTFRKTVVQNNQAA